MKIMSWNVQEAASRDFFCTLKFILSLHKPCVFRLFETKTSGDNADRICQEIEYDIWVRMEAIGCSSGIWVSWNSLVKLSIILTHP